MYVRNSMTKNPHTITADASILDAVAILREKGLRRLPVVNGEKVVGLLTESDIQKVSPTKATSLSIFEINYLLSKLAVKDAMTQVSEALAVTESSIASYESQYKEQSCPASASL